MASSDYVTETGERGLVATRANGWLSSDGGSSLRSSTVELSSSSIFRVNILWIAVESKAADCQSVVTASFYACGTNQDVAGVVTVATEDEKRVRELADLL